MTIEISSMIVEAARLPPTIARSKMLFAFPCTLVRIIGQRYTLAIVCESGPLPWVGSAIVVFNLKLGFSR